MRQLLAVSLLLLLPSMGFCQTSGYEGPASKRTAARMAYLALQKACPRFVEGQEDLLDYSLHIGTPESKNIYGEFARKFGARVVLIVTVRLPPRPTFVPKGLVASDRFFNLTLLDDAKAGGVIILDVPAAFWLCDKQPGPGDAMVLIKSSEVGEALER